VDRNVPAVARERKRDLAADAPRTAGDQRDAVFRPAAGCHRDSMEGAQVYRQ
jgi:hypothetical protein